MELAGVGTHGNAGSTVTEQAMPRIVCALILAVMLSSCSTGPEHATAAPAFDAMIDFAARELDKPRPATPSVWYVRRRELQRICRSDWGCQAVDQVYIRDYCRAYAYVGICQFAMAHEAAHYVLRMAGTYTGHRRVEEPIVHEIAQKWLAERDRRGQSGSD